MSDEVKVSRRSRIFLILSGWGSNARTKTYRFAASYTIFASVLKRAGFPSFGRHSWNAVIGGAFRHAASSSFASMLIEPSARTAVALVSVGAATTRGGAWVPSARGGVDAWATAV